MGTRAGLVGLACAAAGLVYAGSLLNGFALDDVLIVQDNARVRNAFDVPGIWGTPYWPSSGKELGLYRPLAVFLYALQWLYGGGAPWLFHLCNVLLHVGVTALVFLLIERLVDRRSALVGALLFAVHPVHTEAVANVVGQAELVAAAAALAACVVHAARGPDEAIGWSRGGALVLCFAVGLFTKENAIVLPALLVLCDLAQRRIRFTVQGGAEYARALRIPLGLFAVLLAGYLAIRWHVLGGTLTGTNVGPLARLSGGERVLQALRAFPEFFRLLFFPADLCGDYSPGVIAPVHGVTALVAVGGLLLAATALLALSTPRAPAAGFAAAWFLACILPVSNLLFPAGVQVAERTLYLPSFAVCALAAFAWKGLGASGASRAAPIALAILLLVFGARTAARVGDWKDTVAFETALLRDHPECYRAQWRVAARAAGDGDAEHALAHYELGYRIHPHDPQFLGQFGIFLASHGRFHRAVEILEQVRGPEASAPMTVAFLSYAYLRAGRPLDAIAAANRADALGASAAGLAVPVRAAAWSSLGEHEKSIAEWRALCERPFINPWRDRLFLARELALAGRAMEALAILEGARPSGSAAGDEALERALSLAVRSGAYGAVPAAADPLGDYFAPMMAKATPAVRR